MPRGASHSAANLGLHLFFKLSLQECLAFIAAAGTCGCFLFVDDACPILDALVFLSSFLSLASSDAFPALLVAPAFEKQEGLA